ncbi:Grap2 and cyclin-D-interacting-domain-containing protein [Polychytrium aggregatum]|uniref:Grap2 and cyclin-D-interacting-domain-containing protein n=1 Tax=Polychytrium aggregatum TaxID=110093 RepID=UPI0022FE9662|nr:Grap2 and cyclin-D-interacting-domain-containing protein [Polychytrium aggregatum]KAI9205180.1 Grap2 and cyclin-D-interacting-domain-containing protein [Polychytrium aggregatum]
MDAALNTLLDLALAYIADLRQLNPATGSSLQSFKEQDFKAEIEKSATLLSHTTTRLALSANGKSRETASICETAKQALTHLVATVESVPLGLGRNVTKRLRSATSTVVVSFATLLNTFVEHPRDLEANLRAAGYLTSTGRVWDNCELIKAVPLSNAICCKLAIEADIKIFDDVAAEIQTSLDNSADQAKPIDNDADADVDGGTNDDEGDDDDFDFDFDEPTFIAPEDREIVQQTLKLFNSSKMLLKKFTKILAQTPPSVPATDTIEWMDSLVDKTSALVSQLDEISSVLLISPVDRPGLVESLEAIVELASDMMTASKAHVDTAAATWFGLCGTQLHKVLESVRTM